MHMKRHGEFDLYHLSDPGELNGLAQSFAEAYCTIFSGAPYFEAHTPEHALARFDSLVTIPDQISIVARRGKDLAGFAIAVPLVSQPVVAQEFGCGISRDPSNDRFDYDNIICPDKHESPSKWKTIMQDASEYKSKCVLGEAPGHPQLEEYRARWTKSTPDEMDYRFSLWKQGL